MAAPTKPIQLTGLQTEFRNANSVDIDHLSTLELCSVLNNEDATVHTAVTSCMPVIADVIDLVSQRIRKGGRLFYIGAGTSGRLGVLDASEIPPTYSAPQDQFVALVAGGDHALRHAKEGAEDDRLGAQKDLEQFHINPQVDSLIGIASSGRTPYVLGGLAHAKAMGCTTIGLVCVLPSEVEAEGNADFVIAPVTGPEVVTGSTRMKAGTATKLVLNMISTGIMIKLGKTYGNLMVDLRATNMKLRQRARNVIRAVVGSLCTSSDAELDAVLEICHGSVKLACATLSLEISPAVAQERLKRHGGALSRVLEEGRVQSKLQGISAEQLVLCVDAGGSSCKAVVMSADGQVGNGSAGPCNVSTIGIEHTIASITSAITNALSNHPSTRGSSLRTAIFTSAWVAIAGYDRPSIQPRVDKALSTLLRLPIGDGLIVSTDIDLLPASIATRPGIDSAIVLVAGTGSIAMRYQKHKSGFVRTGRAGGWGHLLGDDGSGFGLGREGARIALEASDVHRSNDPKSENLSRFSPLATAILKHIQKLKPTCQPDDVLSGILSLSSEQPPTAGSGQSPAKSIAQLAEVVLSLAETDPEADSILDAGAASLSKLVVLLARGDELDLSRTALILGGGLMQNRFYKCKVLDHTQRKIGKFAHVEFVAQPAHSGAHDVLARINSGPVYS